MNLKDLQKILESDLIHWRRTAELNEGLTRILTHCHADRIESSISMIKEAIAEGENEK